MNRFAKNPAPAAEHPHLPTFYAVRHRIGEAIEALDELARIHHSDARFALLRNVLDAAAKEADALSVEMDDPLPLFPGK